MCAQPCAIYTLPRAMYAGSCEMYTRSCAMYTRPWTMYSRPCAMYSTSNACFISIATTLWNYQLLKMTCIIKNNLSGFSSTIFLSKQNAHNVPGFDSAKRRGSSMRPGGKLIPALTKRVSYDMKGSHILLTISANQISIAFHSIMPFDASNHRNFKQFKMAKKMA